ncbi:MAG: AbrB/MazE/SpoVT family DNA-binding domain-containing protein [Gemmatimonadaceae bacterium]
MEPKEIKVARIGNSRGVRLPASTLDRYHIGDIVIMEERDEGILLRPHGSTVRKLSWTQTAERMARTREDWKEWDDSLADGLETIPWHDEPPRGVAEPIRKNQG